MGAGGYTQNAVEKEMMSLIDTEKFNYHIRVGYAQGYDALYESTNSYFMDKTGKPILYFGGQIGGGGGWGDGSQNTSLSDYHIAPSAVKVRWYSPVEDQFWEGVFQLPKERIYREFKNGYWNVGTNKHAYPNNLTLNVTPGGLVVIWVGGGARQTVVGEYQAERITMDWTEFAKREFYSPDKTKEEYRGNILEGIKEDEDIPEAEKQAILSGNYAKDASYWHQLQQKYLWRLTVNAPFSLKDYRAWYLNGELYYTRGDESAEYKPTPRPDRIRFIIERPEHPLERIDIRFDQEKTIAAFNQFSQQENLSLSLEIAEDFKSIEIYLENEKRNKRIKLEGKEAALVDL